MEGLFDDYLDVEPESTFIEVLEESTEGLRTFYAPEFTQWARGDLWQRLHDAGIGVYYGGN